MAQNTYLVSVKDGNECSIQKNVTVNAGNISYSTDIVPIVMASCGVTNCHDGSNSSRTNLTNYTTLKNNKASCITKLKNGSMPDPPGTISAANKAKLLCWLNDGAPNN